MDTPVYRHIERNQTRTRRYAKGFFLKSYLYQFFPAPQPVKYTDTVPSSQTMLNSNHPLWGMGFRPFFLLCALSGLSLPLIWAWQLSGTLPLLPSGLAPNQWHAHEMFYGFGWAVLGGFLLTATKNWVGIRGIHGRTLILLVSAWLLERLALSTGGSWPFWLIWPARFIFPLAMIGCLVGTLIRYRAQDSFRDNWLFILALPLFLVAKGLLLTGEMQAGIGMSVSLFRLAFLIMFERTLTQFMRGAFQLSILRYPSLDWSIKLNALLLVFDFALPAMLTATLQLSLSLLLLGRFAYWHPRHAFRRIDIGIMYIGYLAIALQLLLSALKHLGMYIPVGSADLHVFTLGAMGTVIPAMLMRVSKGHTGRPVQFDSMDRLCLWLSIVAAGLRVLGPSIKPELYLQWITASAALWCVIFSVITVRFVPLWWHARQDGRPG